jgi:methyl-accepting chemotaxis protein
MKKFNPRSISFRLVAGGCLAVILPLMVVAYIATNITQTSQGIQEVNENVNQSSKVADEISQNITKVSAASANISKSSGDVKNNSSDLLNQTNALNKIVGSFKV